MRYFLTSGRVLPLASVITLVLFTMVIRGLLECLNI